MSRDDRCLVIDVGGGSTRVYLGGYANRFEITTFGELRVAVGLVQSEIGRGFDRIAVSMAGYVDSDSGYVHLSRAAPWAEGDFAGKLRDAFGVGEVRVMNDGEAHALATLVTPGVSFGCVAVALGSSLGFGVISAERKVIRPCSGLNWDLGDVSLETRASRTEAWWALGSSGLAELQESKGDRSGATHFGYRLGAFLAQVATVFQPTCIVMSGGIVVRYWDLMKDSAESEFEYRMREREVPALIRSPFQEAALGGARWAAFSDSQRDTLL